MLTVRGLPFLAAREWRELVTSREFLLFAVLVAPLVGHAFRIAVGTYAEMSGVGGGPAALARRLSPLDGVVVPTFGAYVLAVSLLLPFAAVRLVSAEKESGALDRMLRSPHSLTTQMLVKFAVLVAAWIVAWLPGVAALGIWRADGGHLYAPEVLSVLAGHLWRGALVISVALLAAAVTEGAAAAVALTLAFTLASWALEFVARMQGGLAQQIAELAPEGMLRAFERGEVRLDVIAVMLVTVASNLTAAVVWLPPNRDRGQRWAATLVILVVTSALTALGGDLRTSWDVSEDRRNSFAAADERALRAIAQPVRVEVNLAPEDPRFADLERGVLRKLRRTVRDVVVVNSSTTDSGLLEPSARSPQPAAYGEVWYQVGAKRAMSRSTTEPIVLELIYGLAGITPPPRVDRAYPGYPLAAASGTAPLLFFVVFPGLVAALWWRLRQA